MRHLGAGLNAAPARCILDDKPYRIGGNCGKAYAGDPNDGFNMIPGGDSITGENECARLWRTEPVSIPLAVAGGALLTLGIAILLSTRKRSQKDKALAGRRSNFGVGPGSVSVSGRF